MTRSAATVSRFGVAAVCAALAVAAGCGGQFWTIERTRSLEELSASEIELICERYEGDDTTCPGGWEAGFDSVGQCTGWLERFQSSELYTCRRMQAGEVYDCLDVPPLRAAQARAVRGALHVRAP